MDVAAEPFALYDDLRDQPPVDLRRGDVGHCPANGSDSPAGSASSASASAAPAGAGGAGAQNYGNYNPVLGGYVVQVGQSSVNATVTCTAPGIIGNVGANTITQVGSTGSSPIISGLAVRAASLA